MSQMKEGLQQSRIARYNGPISDYFNVEDRYFRNMPYRIQIVISQPDLDYSLPEVQENIEMLLKNVQNHPLMSEDPDLTESWLEPYLKSEFYHRLSSLDKSVDFVPNLRQFLDFTTKTSLPRNLKFNQEMTRIVASRFLLQTQHVLDATEEVVLLEGRVGN
jgi:hypothetical protein